MGTGYWGLGIGDWGLGTKDNAMCDLFSNSSPAKREALIIAPLPL
ncbi:hypothetical protein [Nostoc sp. CMAA1605]|nr:hypothetical protein [Nostoc sp. CMAA1605]